MILDPPDLHLSMISRIEGAKIEPYHEEILVDSQPGKLYYLTFKPQIGTVAKDAVVKIFLDHQLIGILDNQVKTIALNANQELVLDGSQLDAPIDYQIEIGQGAQTWTAIFSLPIGGISVVPWMGIIGLKEDKGVNLPQ